MTGQAGIGIMFTPDAGSSRHCEAVELCYVIHMFICPLLRALIAAAAPRGSRQRIQHS